MASRSNLSGRPGQSGVLSRVMNPVAPKLKSPSDLLGGSATTSKPRPKGLAGLVTEATNQAQASRPGEQPVNPPRESRGIGGTVADAVRRSRDAQAVQAEERVAGVPRSTGPRRTMDVTDRTAKLAEKYKPSIDPNLGGTDTEQPTRRLPRSPSSRGRRFISE